MLNYLEILIFSLFVNAEQLESVKIMVEYLTQRWQICQNKVEEKNSIESVVNNFVEISFG